MTVIRDSNKIRYPANLWLTEDITSGGELPLGVITSAAELERTLLQIEQQGVTAGWFVNGTDANGQSVRLSTMDD